MPSPASQLPVTIYTPDSGLADPRRLIREMAAELRDSRELAYTLFSRDMKAQFRQSVLGYAWLFFPPIATTCVWFFLNRSGVVRVADTGMPYPAFVMIGTLLWQAFLESLTKPMNAINGARGMLVKLNFPRIAPVLAGIGETTLLTAIRMLLLIPIFIFAGLVPSWTVVFFPLGYVAMLILGTAIGSILTPIGLLYSDVGRAIGILGQFAMYATPYSVINREPAFYLLVFLFSCFFVFLFFCLSSLTLRLSSFVFLSFRLSVFPSFCLFVSHPSSLIPRLSSFVSLAPRPSPLSTQQLRNLTQKHLRLKRFSQVGIRPHFFP